MHLQLAFFSKYSCDPFHLNEFWPFINHTIRVNIRSYDGIKLTNVAITPQYSLLLNSSIDIENSSRFDLSEELISGIPGAFRCVKLKENASYVDSDT